MNSEGETPGPAPHGGGAARRRAARLAAVQLLYEKETGGGDVEDLIIEQLTNRPGATFEGGGFAEIDRDLFADVARGALRRRAQIDGLLGEALSPRWPINRLELILAAVLRCGAYELLLRPDVPARVIINEYLEVAHAFFSGDEPGLVNGVLDRLARRLRPEELHDGGQQRQG